MNNKTLYHDSKKGIIGNIRPISRPISDFGQGFYMGTKQEQAELLVLNTPSPTIYTISLCLDQVPQEQILRFSDTMEWALFVLYNRRMLDDYDNIQETALYQKLADMGRDKEFIIGSIADDSMALMMQQFVEETITDTAFMECIKCIDLGYQYVAKTENACKHITILKEERLSIEKQNAYRETTPERRRTNNRVLKQTRRQYKKEGSYLSEIIEKYEKLAKHVKLAKGISGSISQLNNGINIEYK